MASAVAATAQFTAELPVSTPQYGNAPSDQFGPVVASNGSEFLVAWIDARGLPATLYANRVSGDGRVLDGTGIRVPLETTGANGRLLGAFFVDGAYTLLYSYQLFDPRSNHVAMARISPDGLLVEQPRVIFDGGVGRAAASNGSRIVLSAGDEIVILNGRGEVMARQPITPAYGFGVATNGTTFLVGTFTFDGRSNSVYLIALDANGQQTDVTRIATSASGDGPVIGSDGADYLVIYNDARTALPVAHSVGPHGEIKSTKAALNYSALLWTGQFYLAMSTTMREQEIAVTTVDRTGIPLAPSHILGAGTAGTVNQPAAAWNGREALLTWTSGSQDAPDGLEIVGAITDRSAGVTSPVMNIPRSSRMQVNPVIATSGSQDLVVWVEPDGLYATRMTAEGVGLDGRGIAVTKEATTASRFLTIEGVLTVRAIHDGTAYVVAWGDYRGIKAQRIDPGTGAPLGGAVDLAACSRSFDLVAGPESPVLFFAPCSDSRLFAQRVGLTGGIGAAIPITPDDMLADQPRAAWNGSEWLVIWMKLIQLPLLVSPPLYRGNVYAARMTSAFTPLDTQPLPIAVSDFAESAPLVATDGREFALAWSRQSWDEESGVYIRRIGKDGSLSEPSVVARGSAWPASLVWDGQRYALAFIRAAATFDRDLLLTRFAGHEVPVSATRLDERSASLVAPPGRPLRIIYSRVTPDAEYGGVARIFARDGAGPRRHSVRSR